MSNAIQVSPLNSVLTIVFNNLSTKTGPIVWVCENRAAYDNALDRLSKQSHIEILEHGNSHVEFA